MKLFSAIAHPNIALIKYWGKSDEKNIIPLNPSLSWTLGSVKTTTTVKISPESEDDLFKLNGKEQGGEVLDRVSDFIDLIRDMADSDDSVTIISENNFPTASGIASSASGFAALALAGSKAFGLDLNQEELSSLARKGSGSASRSIADGFVQWDTESAKQLYTKEHWVEMRDIILIVDQQKKSISSREAMRLTKERSTLLQMRLESVEDGLDIVRQAIKNKDFEALAEEIMDESDSMHACIDEVGIHYLNAASVEIIKRVHDANTEGIIAAYTFDAGPNAHIITLQKHVDLLLEKLKGTYKKAIVCPAGEGVTETSEHLEW